ncbi:radical SAM/SPASM domain-containing protein [Pseudomonadota bacterium]
MSERSIPDHLSVPEYIEQERRDAGKEKLWTRYANMIESSVLSEVPPFPRAMLIEVANICNHSCSFCAYGKMSRPSRFIEPEVFNAIVTEGYELGAREIGLHGASEPLTCKKLADHIKTCIDIGFEYVYFTTNGTLGTPEKWRSYIDAGLHSVKFSINAGDAKTYEKIHGCDEFQKALDSVRFVSEYRKTIGRQLYMAVSFVEVAENKGTFDKLKALVEPLVDEVFHSVAGNQSGQMPELQTKLTIPEICHIPFNQVNITREGYLRGCCNDYQNMLVTEDLTKVSLKDAWAGLSAREFRRRHLEDNLKGTICNNCIHGCTEPVKALRPDLAPWDPIL